MNTQKDLKAVAAGASAGVGAYFSALAAAPSVEWWKPVLAAVFVAILAGATTYGVSNSAQTDMATLARQIEAALHINTVVASTIPVGTVPAMPPAPIAPTEPLAIVPAPGATE